MGAANFSRPNNANATYSVCMGYEKEVYKCECGKIYDDDEAMVCDCGKICKLDTVYTHPYEWEAEWVLENLRHILAENVNASDGEDDKVISVIEADKYFGSKAVELFFDVVYEVGYHEGMRIDWNVRGYVDSMEFDVDRNGCNLDYIAEYYELKGTKTMKKWINSKVEAVSKKLDKLLTAHTMPLQEVARFSNGEVMYEKI